MANIFQGTVLKPTRAGTSNSADTSVPVSGVIRDVKPPPTGYTLPYPDVVDIGLQRYKAAILEQENSVEYMVWAANSSNLTRVDDPTWSLGDGSVTIPEGSYTVVDANSPDEELGTHIRRDGSEYLVLRDNQERSISQVLTLTIRNGANQIQKKIYEGFDFDVLDAETGLIQLLDTALTQSVCDPFGTDPPSMSNLRGDSIVEMSYVISPQTFWWTRNDSLSTRFSWSDRSQSWVLRKGNSPVEVGVLTPGTLYTLEPKVTGLVAGSFLPGAISGDAWCMVRLGTFPDSTSLPLGKNLSGPFDGIFVVSDFTSKEIFDFGAMSPPPAAVIGQTNSLIQWNPAFVDQYAGQTIWYNYRSFQENKNGVVGDFLTAKDSSLFIVPVPRLYERPMLRIGSRRYLDTIIVKTESLLSSTFVASGRVGVALSTGKLKFNIQDVLKSDPESVEFEPRYLNDQVFYDGVALNLEMQPPRPPIILQDSDGFTPIGSNNEFYVPNANPFRGLGVSGVENIYDGTGASPTSGVASVRPGGDDPADPYAGLIRQVVGLCSPLIFTKEGPLTKLVVVDRVSDIPTFLYKIPDNTVYVTKENVNGSSGSRLEISSSERSRLSGLDLYYQQPYLTPSLYTNVASIASKRYDFFDLDGTEKLYFALNGVDYVWDSSTLTGTSPYSSEVVADSIDSIVTGPGRVYSFSGHVVIEADNPLSGVVEIGFGSLSVPDLSGCSALGFVPGWQVDSLNPDSYWISDSGVSFGLSPNLMKDSEVADFTVFGRLENEVLQKNISPSDFVFLDPIPLKDIPGYDEDLFFRVQDGDNKIDQDPYEEVLYSFEINKRFSWLSEHSESQQISRPTSFIYLGQRNVVEEGFYPSMGSSFLLSDDGGPFVRQEINEDFILNSQTGTITLTNQVSGLTLQGYRGSFTAFNNQFVDPDADFTLAGVSEGYQLKIPSGSAIGTYIIQSVVNATTLEVSPNFLVSSTLPVFWEIYEGHPLSVYDPSLISDVVYEDFRHLSAETFIIRLLTSLGLTPDTVPDQASNRLVSEVARALEMGRLLSLRVDPQDRQKEWVVGNAVDGIIIPAVNTGSYYYDFGLFTLDVGELSLRPGDGSLTKVESFSAALPSNKVEYIEATGQLKFSSNLLGRMVIYTEDTAAPSFVGGFDISLSLLGKEELGTIANESLFVPDTGSIRFNDEAFSIQIGLDTFQHGAQLEGVASFTSPLPANKIEYLNSTGELKFGEDLLFDYSLSRVSYVEEFLSPSVMTDRTAEVKFEGEINLSEDDINEFGGEPIYFVEQAISEPPDTVINPIDGSFSFLSPVLSGQSVEVEYFQASASGELCKAASGFPAPIREVLPVFIQGEETTRVSDKIYSFNPGGNTIYTPYEPLVYVGAVQKNRGSDYDYFINNLNQIVFLLSIEDPTISVTITYAIAEALGGEAAYSTSTKPVYRPPFYLEKEQESFELSGDRTSQMVPGKLLRLGASCFYLESSAYNASTDITTVGIYPTPREEAGSRAPGKDLISALSNVPIAVGVPNIPNGNLGFMLTLNVDYQSIQKNQRDVTFVGDLTSFAIAGHILQIGGEPYIIAKSQFDENGSYTKVTVASPFTREFEASTVSTRVSARPIYPSGATIFLGPGQIVGDSYEVIVFGETQNSVPLPGRTLISEKHYTIESGSGNIILLSPLQEGIQPGQSFYMRFSGARVLQPILLNDTVIYPRFRATFKYVQIPEETQNKILQATYSYYNPDTFYAESVPLSEYAVEVSQEVAKMVQSQTPGGGGFVVSQGAAGGDKGGTDPLSNIRTAKDKDRAARLYLDYYNRVIVGFEQIYEGITGLVIGDRDGKFKFFVGRFKDVPPPGFEDVVTGYMNPRSLWSEVFRSRTVSSPYPLVTVLEDNIVNPATAVLSNGTLSGELLDPEDLSLLMGEQKVLVKNDMDDFILTRTGGVQTVFIPGSFPLQSRGQVSGVHQRMASPQVWSRLYPLRSRAFTTTYPGLGADVDPPGVYSFSYTYENSSGEIVTASTHNKPIAQLGNPVLGDLTKIQKTSIGYRLPRAWVWDYSPEGFPEIDILTAGIPCIVASMVPLSEFPVTSEGLPDPQYLMSVPPGPPGPEDKYDLSSGNPDLHMPPFEPISSFSGLENFYSGGKPQRLALGKPDGSVIDLASTQESFGLLGGSILSGIFVNDVLQGCLITMCTPSGVISDSNSIVKTTEEPLKGEPVTFERGDTIFVVPGEPFEISDTEEVSPTSSGVFRPGVDFGLNSETGELLDVTPPNLFGSVFTSPVTVLLGSNGPKPLRTIEGSIEYQSTRLEPVGIPALLGQNKDDNGDYTLPFIGSDLQEPKLLKEVFDSFVKLLSDTTIPNSIYPEEFLASDGEVLSSVSGLLDPGVLITQTNLKPSSTVPYIPNSGVGNLRPYDFLFIQTDSESGYEGLLSVGDVSYDSAVGSWIDPPRFVTQTRKGDRVRYLFDNCMVHLGPGFVTIVEGGGFTDIILDPSVPLTLDDGSNIAVGGLNSIVDNLLLPFPNENKVIIDLFDTTTGVFQERITITGNAILPAGIVQTQVFPGSSPFTPTALFYSKSIRIPLTGWITPGFLGVPFHFSISVDTQDTGSPSGNVAIGSVGAWVSSNRVTFNESYDLTQTAPEGAVQSQLSVMTVTDWNSDLLEVNSPDVVNGGFPFTFKPRSGSLGTWTPATSPGAGDENGDIKVTSFRGFGNLDLTLSNLTFAGLPSSDSNETEIILQGSGDADSVLDMRITSISPVSGSVENVEPGDVLVIQESFSGQAISKAGTYLVRKAVEDPGPGYKEVITTASSGGGGWVEIDFPTVVSFDEITEKLTISSTVPFSLSTTGHSFSSTGRIYVITNPSNVTSTDPAVFAKTCVSASYSSIDPVNPIFTLVPGTYRDANNILINATLFGQAISAGMTVSGMVYFPVNMGGIYNLPEVGLDSPATPYGMVRVNYTTRVQTQPFLFDYYIAGTPDTFEVQKKPVVAFNQFTADPAAPFYENIPGLVSITELSDISWDFLHNPSSPGTTVVRCVLPGETFQLTFHAESGIFLEPTVPTSVFDLGGIQAHVIDSAHTGGLLPVSEFGFRGSVAYPSILEPEPVNIEVRRIRRFHEPLQKISSGFGNLRYLNEVRRGVVSVYSTTSNQYGLLTTTPQGTNLGGLDESKVNVRAGDLFRLLDVDGNLLEEVEISGVLDPVTLMLNPPGLLTTPVAGLSFEIYLRSSPVPYGQSVEQLLDLMTEEVLLRRTADLGTNTGGYVDTVNELKDSEPSTFGSLGVQVGDIVLIDPAGEIVPGSDPEFGSRPLGDVSVFSRPTAHVPGGPSYLDDNRGFYRVSQVNNESLTVTGASSFAGDHISGDTIFYQGTTYDYAVYPTISDSDLTGGTEGQNDLRPTAYESGGSFLGDPESIAPFSYRILRARQLITEEAIDLILVERDRMLSWLELLRSSVQEIGGTYYLFQLNAQIYDLSLGVISNAQIEGLGGIIYVAPFANNSSCLSVLDRRFWISDFDLDISTPPGSPFPYAGFRVGQGRPVLPDYIDLVLDFRDQIRNRRMSWIRFRSNLVEGTLAEIDRSQERAVRNDLTVSTYNLIKGDI